MLDQITVVVRRSLLMQQQRRLRAAYCLIIVILSWFHIIICQSGPYGTSNSSLSVSICKYVVMLLSIAIAAERRVRKVVLLRVGILAGRVYVVWVWESQLIIFLLLLILNKTGNCLFLFKRRCCWAINYTCFGTITAARRWAELTLSTHAQSDSATHNRLKRSIKYTISISLSI